MGNRIITPDLLHEYIWVCDPFVHPNGQSVAYVYRRTNQELDQYASHIRVAAMDGSGDEAWTSGTQDGAPSWSPNGDWLGFTRPDKGARQLFGIRAAGETPTQLASSKRGIAEWSWSPDGELIAYTTRINLDPEREAWTREEERAYAARRGAVYDRYMPRAEGTGWWDGLYSHLFVTEPGSGQVKQVTDGPYDVSQPKWSPDGRSIAYLSHIAAGDPRLEGQEPHRGLYIVSLVDGAETQAVPGSFTIERYAWSPDGTMLAWIGHDNRYGAGTQHALYVVDLKRSGSEAIVRLSADDVQLGVYVLNDMTTGPSVPGPFFVSTPQGLAIAAVVTRHGEAQLWQWQLDGSAQPLTSESWVIWQAAQVQDRGQFVVQAIGADGPAELYVVDGSSIGSEHTRITRLTSWNRDLAQSLAVSQPEPFWFTNSAGDQVQAWIMRPNMAGQVAEGGRVPVVLAIHGGPHAMYAGVYYHEFQTLTAASTAVVFTNPRGSFGYGQQFAAACLGRFGEGDAEDVLQALDEALARYDWLDPLRTGVMGGSYGGLMTNWLVGRTNRFRAAVSQRSITNWLSFCGNSDIGPRYAEAMLGTNPWKDAARYWERSPIAYADRVTTPTLIMHGADDLRCPVEQADQYYTALKRHGKTTKLIRYAGSGHAFQKAGKPSLRIDVLEQVNAWFEQYLLADRPPLVLGIPFALLLENCRSAGVGDAVILESFRKRDFSPFAQAREPGMDFAERVSQSEELGIDWQRVLSQGYTLNFLHTNALKRLLLFKYGLTEARDYVQEGYELSGIPLAGTQAAELLLLIHRQWNIIREAEGTYRLVRKQGV